MDLFLIRHGIAVDRAACACDADRPLTPAGQQKTARVAARLGRLGIRFETILSSPLLRARQTADLLLQAGLAPQLELCEFLAPAGKIGDWWAWQQQWQPRGDRAADMALALVGHQPDLGNWAEILVWGSAREKLVVKKAGTIGVRLPANASDPVACGELFLLTASKWLL